MRDKIYIWLPAIMLIYLAAMAFTFKDDLLSAGHYLQFYLTIAVELLVIILLFIFLRKRTRMRKERHKRETYLNQTEEKLQKTETSVTLKKAPSTKKDNVPRNK